MIDLLTSLLDTRLASALPVDTRYGLCERIKTDQGERPVKYTGGGQMVHVLEDASGNVSYWRVTGTVQQSRADIGEACSGIEWRFPLRLVFFLDRASEVCDGIGKAIGDVMIALKQSERAAESAIDAVSVSLTGARSEIDSTRAAQNEVPGLILPPHRAMCYVDVDVVAKGNEACFNSCDAEPYDPCADCGEPGEGCTDMDITVNVNGSFAETVSADPCVNNTLNITIT